jgi:hypothetical protein
VAPRRRRPDAEKIQALAELLHVDAGWLEHGEGPVANCSLREQRARNATGLRRRECVAGMIQMDGGTIAFPDDDEIVARREAADIFAIIKGARYSLRVASGKADGDSVLFETARPDDSAVALVVVRDDGFSYRVFEVPAAVLSEHGRFTRGAFQVSAPVAALRPVVGFDQRI